MIVDTSAIMAILLDEPEKAEFAVKIASAATLVEIVRDADPEDRRRLLQLVDFRRRAAV